MEEIWHDISSMSSNVKDEFLIQDFLFNEESTQGFLFSCIILFYLFLLVFHVFVFIVLF
jgi:hypothetical protein